MARRNKKNRNRQESRPISQQEVGREVKNLGRRTSHGFQEYTSLKDLNDFFTTDPDELPGAFFEPPMLKKATPNQLLISKGNR